MLYYLCYMAITKQGGTRKNSGRKELPEKKIPVTTYHYLSVINKKHGGLDKFKAKINAL